MNKKSDEIVSIIVPVYNESGNITPLINSIRTACCDFPHEIIVVDDGSTDGTLVELEKIETEFTALRVLTLKRNFGQTAALAAGIDHAKGGILVTLDGDGQNDPSDIPALLQKISEGFDVVSGWRKNRKDKIITRKIPSWIANSLISFVTDVHLHDYGCTLKAYKKKIISNLQISGEMHRFLPAWCVWQGGRVAEIVVKHHPRIRGKSKYGLMRIFKVLIDLMTLKFFSGYLSKPNYLFSGTGLILFVLGLLATAVALADKFGPDRWPKYRYILLMFSVFFCLASLFLVLMGLMMELLIRLYFHTTDQRPYRLRNE